MRSVLSRSYKLPDELDEWGEWVADNPGADTGMWMLKNNKQVRACVFVCTSLKVRQASKGHRQWPRAVFNTTNARSAVGHACACVPAMSQASAFGGAHTHLASRHL